MGSISPAFHKSVDLIRDMDVCVTSSPNGVGGCQITGWGNDMFLWMMGRQRASGSSLERDMYPLICNYSEGGMQVVLGLPCLSSARVFCCRSITSED